MDRQQDLQALNLRFDELEREQRARFAAIQPQPSAVKSHAPRGNSKLAYGLLALFFTLFAGFSLWLYMTFPEAVPFSGLLIVIPVYGMIIGACGAIIFAVRCFRAA